MSEIKYADLEKGQKGFAIIELKDNYAIVDKMFTNPGEAEKQYQEYKLKTGKFELTEIVRK